MLIAILFIVCVYVVYILYLMYRFLDATNNVTAEYAKFSGERNIEKKKEFSQSIRELIEDAKRYYYKLSKLTYGFETIKIEKRYLDEISKKIDM